MDATDKRIGNSSEGRNSLEAQLEYQKRLNNITNKIHSAKDTDDILLNLQGEILGLFDADRITIYVVDGIKKEIVSRLKTGDEVNEIRVPINNGSLSGYSAASGKVVNILDVYDQNELNRINPKLRFDKSWDQITGYKTTQVLAAPIFHNQYLQGVIQLINKRAGQRFTEADHSSVQDIAKVLGAAFFKNRKVAEKAKSTRFDYLVGQNIISRDELVEAMTRARQKKSSVESVLMADFHVSKDDIGKSLSDFYQTRFIPYDDKMIIPGQLLKGLRVNFLKNNNFVPVVQSEDTVVVAMENPASLPARDAIKRLIKAGKFEYCVSLKEDIRKMIDMFFNVKRTEILPSSGSIEDILGQLKTVEDDEDDVDIMTEDDSVIVQLLNKIIVDAFNRGASDIHIEPRSGKKPAIIRIRIDGACQIYQTIPHTYKRAWRCFT